jgi:hypothetical protein
VTPRSTRTGEAFSRRVLLRAGVLATVAVPLAACSGGYDTTPDPLAPLADAARADADSAGSIAEADRSAAELAAEVGDVRRAHDPLVVVDPRVHVRDVGHHDDGIGLVLRASSDTLFLGLIGISEVQVAVESNATAITGDLPR